MIHLVHIITDSNIGGAGRSLLNYLACYDRTKFRVQVVLPRGSALKERIEALGIPLTEIDNMADRSLAPKAIAPLVRFLRHEKPDLVHTHGSLSGRIAARMAHCPVIYTRHCAFSPSALRTSLPARAVTRLADALLSDGVIAVGAAAKDILVSTGIPAEKIHVMLNGVAPLPIPGQEERAALRAAYGFTGGDFVVGILARIEEYKGQGILLDAVSSLAAQGRPIKMLVAGTGSFEEELRRRAAALPEGTVVFAGFVREVEKALGAMDVQINASTLSEASPLSLMEGMSMGLPSVVSDIGGNPLHITDGENGFVVPHSDPDAMAGRIRRLMDEPETLAAMSRRAVEIFNERFTAEIFAKNVESVYVQTLKGAHHGK